MSADPLNGILMRKAYPWICTIYYRPSEDQRISQREIELGIDKNEPDTDVLDVSFYIEDIKDIALLACSADRAIGNGIYAGSISRIEIRPSHERTPHCVRTTEKLHEIRTGRPYAPKY